MNKLTLPTKSNLKGRTSTISNAFAHSIDPRTASLSNKDLENYYKQLKIKEGQCAYCMQENSAYTVDHFHPLIKNKKPTGYFTENNNLIPCCPRCNSKKGGRDFGDWYKDPKTIKYLREEKHLSDFEIEQRYKILVRFSKVNPAKKIDYESILGKEKWNELCNNIIKLCEDLEKYQAYCEEIQKKLKSIL